MCAKILSDLCFCFVSQTAVLGKTAEEIEQVCSEIDGYVVPVNYNSAAQTVIAGETAAAEAAAAKFAEMGAKAVKLGVSSAFHSKLMQPAAEEFEAALKEMLAGFVAKFLADK